MAGASLKGRGTLWNWRTKYVAKGWKLITHKNWIVFFFFLSRQVSMYTVVSLIVDLAGEPDTVNFTLALFGSSFIVMDHCELIWRSVPTPNMRSHYALWPAMVRNNLICARYSGAGVTFILTVREIKTSIVFLHPRFLLSLRAPVRGTLPCTAPCLPRRISQTRMTTVLNLGRHHLLPVTLYPGTCPDMSGPRGKSREDRYWIRQREPCLESQVRGSLLVVLSSDSNVLKTYQICCNIRCIGAVHELTETYYGVSFPGIHSFI